MPRATKEELEWAYALTREKFLVRVNKLSPIRAADWSRYLDVIFESILVEDLVDTRNDMAHASGKFEILTEESYDAKVSSILSSMGVICRCMDRPIRKWYGQGLLSFCKGEYEGYDDPKDFIVEQMIQTFKLSTNELLICNEMSVSSLITEHRGYEVKLKAFKKALKEYCQEMGFV